MIRAFSLEVLEKLLCGFFGGSGFFFRLFAGGLGALGVLGEEFGELLHRLIIINLPDGSQFAGHAEQGLLEQLAETENPYLCPHGRPIVVTVGFHELDKQFKRA